MERETNPMQPMCRSGCGFYGNPAQEGLCSVCYKDSLRKKQQPPVSSTPVSSVSNTSGTASSTNIGTVGTPQSFSNSSSSVSVASSVAVTNTALPTVQSLLLHENKEKISDEDSGTSSNDTNDTSANDNDDKDGKKKKNRCATCRKKVGLTGSGFECRCGGLFCAIHRYSDKHECTFDYRELGAAEIRRNNPVVVGEKIQKI